VDVVDSEVVAYESAAAARDALAELRTAVDACEPDPDAELLPGSGIRYGDVTRSKDRALPLKDHLMRTMETTQDGVGTVFSRVDVVQRHENLVVVVTYEENDEIAAGDLAVLQGLPGVLGERLLAEVG
jgi:hypothetical protein